MALSGHKKTFITLTLLFCAFAGLWRYFIADKFLALPKDFTYEAELTSVDNFYDTTNNKYLGQTYSNSTFSYKTISSTMVGNIIENSFNVEDSSGNSIISINREYGIDPSTGQHINNLGDENREGYLFAPKNLKPGQGFTYWHVNYDGPAVMAYTGRETLEGLEVYTYETHYENVDIDQTEDLTNLEGVPEKYGIVLDPYLKLWIEPVTGTLINFEDDTTAYFYDIETGYRLDPWNHFSNSFTEESIGDKIKAAKTAKTNTQIIYDAVPFGFLALALFAVLYYFFRKPTIEGTEDFGIHWVIHLFVVAFPITLILVCWHLVVTSINSGNDLRFENRITEIEDTIIRSIDVTISSLEGIQGLFQASQTVERAEWASYIQQLNLEEDYPGIKSVGYTPIILDADKEAHIHSVKAEGFTDYTISPEGIRESYAPVMYIEPLTDQNTAYLGTDAFTNTVRNAGMNFARDMGTSSFSGKLEFVPLSESATNTGAATVITVPIYKKELPLTTIEEKRAAINGYVYASFWIDDFMNKLFGSTPLGVNFKVYDGTDVKEESLLYEYYNDPTQTETDGFRTKTETIYIDEHPWTFTFDGLVEFRSSKSQKWLTWGLLWLALLLCALFIFIYFSLVVSRDRAMEWLAKVGRKVKGSKRSTLRESPNR